VEVAQLSQLAFEVSDPGRRPIPLCTLAECQGSVLFHVDAAGAARGGMVDGERRGGGALSISARVGAQSQTPFLALPFPRGKC
jgi:hypothetical protein